MRYLLPCCNAAVNCGPMRNSALLSHKANRHLMQICPATITGRQEHIRTRRAIPILIRTMAIRLTVIQITTAATTTTVIHGRFMVGLRFILASIPMVAFTTSDILTTLDTLDILGMTAFTALVPAEVLLAEALPASHSGPPGAFIPSVPSAMWAAVSDQ